MLRQRAWYYTHIFADPQDSETVYALNTGFYKSTDGGKTFTRIPVGHGDCHDLWVNPTNTDIMLQLNDGGAHVSLSGGRSWSTLLNQATAEFYRVFVDNQFPYRVYGPQQDNSTISVPSIHTHGITPFQQWYDVAGGEAGHISFDPDNPDIVYAGSIGNRLTRVDVRTGYARSIKVYPELDLGQAARDLKYRFQWNAPVRVDPHDASVLYMTSNQVHRTRNGGQSWETLSADLTRDDDEKQDFPGYPITNDSTTVEVYDTIFSFEISPYTKGHMWAGSDDGLVHVSRDDGATWNDVTPDAMPDFGVVNSIRLLRSRPGPRLSQRLSLSPGRLQALYLSHRRRRPRLDARDRRYQRHPRRPLRAGGPRGPRPPGTPLRGDRVRPLRLLRRWRALAVAPAGPAGPPRSRTSGCTARTWWSRRRAVRSGSLDDLTPLHQMSAEVEAASAWLFAPRAAYRMQMPGGFGLRYGWQASPENPKPGVSIYYAFDDAVDDEVTLELLDSSGAVIRTYSSEEDDSSGPAGFGGPPSGDSILTKKEGMNRFVWDFTYPGATPPQGVQTAFAGNPRRGPQAPPGTYQARLNAGDWSQTQRFEIVADPRLETTQDDWNEQLTFGLQVRDRLSEIYESIATLRSVREQADETAGRVKDDSLTAAAATLSEKLTGIEDRIVQSKSESGQDNLNFPPEARQSVRRALQRDRGLVLRSDRRHARALGGSGAGMESDSDRAPGDPRDRCTGVQPGRESGRSDGRHAAGIGFAPLRPVAMRGRLNYSRRDVDFRDRPEERA